MAHAARSSWKVLVLLSFVGYQFLAYFVLRDSPGAAAVSGLTHAAAYLILFWYFARTLREGKEPLITRLARSVRGSLPPEIVAITRRVTLAWSAFFAAQVLGSMLLLVFAPFDIWSMFVNLLNFPLLALMFVGDHLYHAIRFPDYPRPSIARVLRAFAEVTSEPEGNKAH
jgi:ABC-type polysaccharide/polyol phosphate export permease